MHLFVVQLVISSVFKSSVLFHSLSGIVFLCEAVKFLHETFRLHWIHLFFYSSSFLACILTPSGSFNLHAEMFLSADMQRYESALSWKAHDGEVYSVEFSYDENTVFSIGEDGKVMGISLRVYSHLFCNL